MTKVEPTASTRGHPTKPPRILFEDPHLIVLSKPAGLLSQGEHRGDENLVDWLRGYLGRPYVGLVHRLDRNTSGVMIVAKRSKSAQRLTLALQEGEMERVYRGWIQGVLRVKVRWEHSLQKNEKTNQVRVVKSGGKPSVLTAVPLEYGVWKQIDLTLAQFQLETGRSHQIRVQAAHEGYALLGDTKYGPLNSPRTTFPRLALHSYSLKFPHPISHEILNFQDPLPRDLDQIQRSGKPLQDPTF